jgi:phytoene desaturase
VKEPASRAADLCTGAAFQGARRKSLPVSHWPFRIDSCMEATPTLSDRYDVVVIGAGMGGLSAAGWLARAGLSVAVLEKHSKLGGYGQYFGREVCFDSDTLVLSGAAPGGWLHSALGPTGALEKVELISLQPSYRVRTPGQDLLVPPDPERLRHDLSARFPAEAAGIERFISDARMLGSGYLTLASGAEKGSPLDRIRFQTAAQMLRGYIQNPQLQGLLSALWPLAGLPPGQLAATQFIALWHAFHQQGGACVVRGGMRCLGQAMADCVTERGGAVALRSPVRSVRRRGGRAVGVELEDGGRIECGAIIANGNPQDLFEQLLDRTDGRVPDYPPLQGTASISAMQVHLIVDMPIELPAQVTVVHRSDDYESAFATLQRDEPDFPSFMLSLLDHADPERAPAGQHLVVLFGLQPYSRQDGWNAPMDTRRTPAYRTLPDYVALKDRIADRLIEAAGEVIPGLSEHVTTRRAATPITMERYTFNTGGAAFGWANIPAQSGALRPGPETPVRGLFLAGHWTFPGSGISAAMVSGQIAAQAVLGHTRSAPPSARPAARVGERAS